MIWCEKYRPKTFDEVVGQDVIVSEMQNITRDNMNHFLLHSVGAGTGKTSIAYLLASHLGFNLHIYNASSKRTRGIEFIEEEIIPMSQSGMWETIILLDEADRLTLQAQDALKGVIENATCYFVLTCNDISKVTPFLQSRCQLRHFKEIEVDAIIDKLIHISNKENCYVPLEHIKAIAKAHEGDLRNAINCLQAYNTVAPENRDSFVLSLDISDFNPKTFLRICAKEQSVDMAVGLTKDIPMRVVIRKVFDYAVNSDASAEAKMRVIESTIISERDILQGCDEEIVRWDYCRMLASRD